MKLERQRGTQNVEGDFFVDHKCIDCDTCRWMAPQVFTRVDEQSAVYKQPSTEKERLNALQALLSCPTSSIHTEKPARDILEVQKTFPLRINEQRIPGIFDCGYHSEASYGATSYFITHPDGNILVDSSRYTERLAHTIEILGGVRYMFLTHRDDVADHNKWSKRFGCDRVLHSQDVSNISLAVSLLPLCFMVHQTIAPSMIEDNTADVEIKLDGDGPWNLGNDFELFHTPGHTRGSVCLLYKPLKVLFAGDHISKDQSELSMGEQYNQQSGHGRRVEFKDTQEKNKALKAFLVMKGQAQTQSV
ncbi:hypothetical protein C5167_049900 [Papaver somniferum]|uniref:Metallo-beta-lactamase domain-containing protein n=1 Tax=Papaver somniferum TaxID=3469 RepID=A0A4Y7KR27_PAPSO|nr:hypothetical protein C5167_049900 [Papaver somniferum]